MRYRYFRVIGILFCLLCSCESQNLWEVIPGKCLGFVNGNTTPTDLTNYIPATQLKKTQIILGQDPMPIPATYIYHKTPNEALILWDEINQNVVAAGGLFSKADGSWLFPSGIAIGTSLETIVHYNKAPVELRLNLDVNQIQITGFNEGSLASYLPYLTLILEPTAPFSTLDFPSQKGLTGISSNPDIQKMNLTLAHIHVFLHTQTYMLKN
jgi:hypothetical protein